jgi:hypothetical protein
MQAPTNTTEEAFAFVPGDIENYRSNSWHSSHLTLPAAEKPMSDSLKAPLLRDAPDNPYLKNQNGGRKTVKDVSKKKSKKKDTAEKLMAAKEMVKRSDIRVSAPVKIDDLKRVRLIFLDKF